MKILIMKILNSEDSEEGSCEDALCFCRGIGHLAVHKFFCSFGRPGEEGQLQLYNCKCTSCNCEEAEKYQCRTTEIRMRKKSV